MSRDDLLTANAEIVSKAVLETVKLSPEQSYHQRTR
jgi:malate/lactate dehydrogenase